MGAAGSPNACALPTHNNGDSCSGGESDGGAAAGARLRVLGGLEV